jgi:hypothetical protein
MPTRSQHQEKHLNTLTRPYALEHGESIGEGAVDSAANLWKASWQDLIKRHADMQALWDQYVAAGHRGLDGRL